MAHQFDSVLVGLALRVERRHDVAVSMSSEPSNPYPAEWEADVVLSDGGTACVRPIRPDDSDRLVAFHGRQSPESIYLRFFSPRPELPPQEVTRLVTVDYRDRMAFIALEGDDMIGVARYEPWADRNEAEVAFFIDDAHHGRGIATLLLEYLAVAARDVGLDGLTASVLPENSKMLGVFHAAGFDVTSKYQDGVIDVRLGIEPTDAGAAAIERRARTAEARSVERIVAPSSVAVIGGSRPGAFANEIVRNLVSGGFTGPVHPVSRTAGVVAGLPTVDSLLDVDGDVDLAVIAVPKIEVSAALDDCIAKGVRGVVVTSAGFSETGAEGAADERALVAKARRNGLRILGPNCLGLVNTDPEIRLNGSLVSTLPAAGAIAMSTQSGALGRVLIEGVSERGLGLSHFVALGNKADISGNDLLQFWDLDDRTDVILLHLESLGNPRRFQRIARAVSAHKPVVAVTTSITESIESGDHWPGRASFGALVEQAGVIEVETFDQLLDTGWILASCPVPSSTGAVLVGNSGAALRLGAAAAERAGLDLVRLGPELAASLTAQLPAGARLDNPIDLTHAATPDHYRLVLDALLFTDGVDSVAVVHAPPLPEPIGPVATVLDEVARAHPEVAIVACAPGYSARREGAEANDAVDEGAITTPIFGSPHAAVESLGRVARYGARRKRIATQAGEVGTSPTDWSELIDIDAARAIIDGVRGAQTWTTKSPVDPAGPTGSAAAMTARASSELSEDATVALLEAAGLHPIARRSVSSADEAAEAAMTMGYPVVLKAGERGPLARTQDTGVALDLRDESSLRSAHEQMSAGLGSDMDVAEVQAMAAVGIDAVVSLHQSREHGAAITLGRGGAGATPLHLRPVRILPVDEFEAARLIAKSELGPVLDEVGADSRALVELVCRLAALGDAVPELVEVELNPVIVGRDGATITDVASAVSIEEASEVPAVRRLR